VILSSYPNARLIFPHQRSWLRGFAGCAHQQVVQRPLLTGLEQGGEGKTEACLLLGATATDYRLAGEGDGAMPHFGPGQGLDLRPQAGNDCRGLILRPDLDLQQELVASLDFHGAPKP
jgi:hypothetical protein